MVEGKTPKITVEQARLLSSPATIGRVSAWNGWRFVVVEVAHVLDLEGFVRVKQAAALLGVSPNTIRAWGADGRIPEYRHPVNNYRLYKLTDLEKILRKLAKPVSGASKKGKAAEITVRNTLTKSTTDPKSPSPEDNGAASPGPVTVRDSGPYSARNSSKGALIEEAGRVFAALSRGESVQSVRDQVLHGTLLTQRSRDNRERIWTSIQTRYLNHAAPWLTSQLAEASTSGPHSPEFVSLLYLLYALRDRLTFDFVTAVLWPKGHQTRPVISRNQLLDLLKQVAEHQPQIERWAESTRIKLAGSILTALRDFGLLEGQQKKVLVRPLLPLSTAEALLRILAIEGCRGRELLQDPAWRLFLLTEQEVASTLAKLAQQGTIRFEKAGATVVLETPDEWEDEP